ncbi:MAG: ABC transporter ATP-binding protein [Defluviitaleaceae bacterium]|nr:ABC transporter ATP-binding protein [Defluviitaleaceae bacterium]
MNPRGEFPVLEVRNLQTYFYTTRGIVKAVDDVSFAVQKGKTLGIVGESGCGKSITSLSIMRLLPALTGKVVGGEILFKDRNLLELSDKEMRSIRGNDIAMIFQEPMTSLNPAHTIGKQISEAIKLHKKTSEAEAKNLTLELLSVVKIPNPEKRYDQYPHQLSGGMRQRVMIAMALSCEPEVLICDEPTTALDVTIQAQILDLIVEMKNKFGTGVMMITHDLGVIAEVADDVIVMYAGKVAERASVDDLFENPLHPYTEGLLNSIPKLHRTHERLKSIKGMMPKPTDLPDGCLFHTRCDYVKDICKKELPEEIYMGGRTVACWKYHDKWKEQKT